jgi:putative transposase
MTREIVGYEFTRRGRAKKAGRALESACLARCGTLRPGGGEAGPSLRQRAHLRESRFRAACRDYKLRQEFITPCTRAERDDRTLLPQAQRGMRVAADRRELSRGAGRRWIEWYSDGRSHQALGYRSPRQYRADKLERVA